MRLYVYPHVEPPIHDSIVGFRGTTPFGGDGIEKHFTITNDPNQADLFWMGQYNEARLWLLHPNRFRWFEADPAKHVIDLEGDWRDGRFPDWLKRGIIITGNWDRGRYGLDWNILVRPIMSPLLMRLVRNPPEYKPPIKRLAWFRGQRDSLGVRERMADALKLADIPHSIFFNEEWMVYAAEDSPGVRAYLSHMDAFFPALCPRGEGQATCRFYEACAFGRAPIVIANNVLPGTGEYECATWPAQLSDELDADALARGLLELWDDPFPLAGYAYNYFREVLIPYFRDPTEYFVQWALKRNFL
jgi:hypothetical protein